MKCLVTGSAGFIGSHAVKELKKRGHEVLECDPRNLGDISRITEDDLKDVDWIFHFGAASGSLHFNPPESGVDVNCTGTTHLLEMAKRAGVKKFVFSSTGSSYGGTAIPHVENTVLNCPNFYTATKIFDELACKLYNELYGLDTVILRYASVYGDNEDSKKDLANVVSQFIWNMMKGEQPELWGNGKQSRDLIFVDDIVGANIFAAENLGGGKVYNVGTGVETSFVDAIGKINAALGTKIEPKFVTGKLEERNVQKKYVDRQLFNTEKLAKAGWRSMVSVDEGIRRIVEDLKMRKA